MILSLLYKSELRAVRLILIDPKMLSFGLPGHPAPARAGRHRHEAGNQRLAGAWRRWTGATSS